VILVAGGTGRLGSILVADLTARGFDVRVLTRDRTRAEHLRDVADVVVGDVRAPATVAAAMAGVRTAVSAVHGFAGPGRVTPRSVDRDGNANLVTAAAEVGADVVMLSVVGASPDSPMELFRAKHQAERHLKASGVGWTIVRSTAFIELWAQIMAKPIVLGRGSNPINFVSVHDVAAVVELAVTDPSLRGEVLEVGGPRDLTFNEVAELMQTTRDQRARIRHVPRGALRVLAPFARPAAAALTMDTHDMTFDAVANRAQFADLPFTDPEEALTIAVSTDNR
jgi:NADH dehydrogenase